MFRPFLALIFLLALQVVFTFWSEAGGQYHLDLMFWPWKFGLGLTAAGLITAIAAGRRRPGLYVSLLVLAVLTAMAVTYYYHLHEPDEDDTPEPQTQLTRI